MATSRRTQFRLSEPAPASERRRIAEELGLPEPVAALAWQRGLRDSASWSDWRRFDPAEQHDPMLLPDMDLAVDRLLFAREHDQRVLVHGDYDVDGLTGAALLLRALRSLGFSADAFVPHRERDGYGLSRRALEHVLERGFSLVVTVDCGASEGEIIEEMALRGLETVVTDHHLASDRPEALAYVNPMRPDSTYPFRNLAGSAIAYKLARALHEALGRPLPPERWLDFVALGTVADVMPLVGENRIFVRAGLREMSRLMTARPGSSGDHHPVWRALAKEAKIGQGEIGASDLAFRMAPRLNAPGRLSGARLSLDLLCSEDHAEAAQLAARVESINLERRKLEAGITEEAMQLARARIEKADEAGEALGVLALASAGWHPGVIGISAARLVDAFGLPALLTGLDAEGAGRGSGRGLPGLHLKELLDGVSEHLSRHGGHARAVGYSLAAGHAESFATALEANVPPPETAVRNIDVDLVLKPDEIDRVFLDGVEQLGPFGEGNPEPLFLLQRAIPTDYRVFGGQHLRLDFLAGGERKMNAILFARAEEMLPRVELGAETDLCFRVARDTWQRAPGDHGVSLHLQDFSPTGAAS